MSSQAIKESDVVDGLSVRYLKIFGLWGAINDYRTTGKRNRYFNAQLLVILSFTLPYIFCQFFSYFFINVDIHKFMFINLNLFPATQLCCKMFVFWYRIDSLSKLFNLIKKDFLLIPNGICPQAIAISKKISRKANMLCLASLISNSSFLGLFVLNPGISVDYILYHTGDMAAVKTGRKKIFGGWYPVPMAETPYFEVIFFSEMIYGISAGVLLSVYVCVYYQILMSLYAQFTILGLKVSTLFIKSSNFRRKNYFQNKLHKILQEHQELLSYAKGLRSVYNPLVTLILGIGIFVLIIAIYQFLFGGKGDPMIMLKYLLFLCYQFVEVSMFCFGSAYIETASSDLQFAVYSSDWYKADVKFRKAAQMMMLRAGKGETLTAIRMYPINLETMMSILHFTYSASAVVSRMAD